MTAVMLHHCNERLPFNRQLILCHHVQAFSVQSFVTGEGPYANWAKHVADPFGYNLLTIVGNEERVPTL